MSEPLDQEIRTLRAQYWSARDPEGRAFAPLAETYRLQGELEEAASLIKDGIERHPDFVAGYLVAARIAQDRGDLLGAQSHLDRLLVLDPENVVARFERATVALEEGDREGALSDLRIVLDLDPSHRDASLRLGEIESGSGWDSELDSLPEAIESSPLEADDVLPSEANDFSLSVGNDFTPSEAFEFDPSEASTAPVEPQVSPEVVVPNKIHDVAHDDHVFASADEGGIPLTPALNSDLPGASESHDEGPDRALFTRTMGDLYAAQGFLDRAIEVYEHLSAIDPEDADLSDRLAALRLREVGAGGEDHGTTGTSRPRTGKVLSEAMEASDIAEASSPGETLAMRPVRKYFADLLAWVPGAVPIDTLAPDPLEESEPPIPIALLAPDSIELELEVEAAVAAPPYPELGLPIPIELLAPDTDHPSDPPSSPDDGDDFASWLEKVKI